VGSLRLPMCYAGTLGGPSFPEPTGAAVLAASHHLASDIDMTRIYLSAALFEQRPEITTSSPRSTFSGYHGEAGLASIDTEKQQKLLPQLASSAARTARRRGRFFRAIYQGRRARSAAGGAPAGDATEHRSSVRCQTHARLGDNADLETDY
jgi:hypothetical protein